MTPTVVFDALALLVSASIKGSIILLVALVALRIMRRASAASRHAVLAAALAAFILLPAVQAVAPKWTVALLPAGPAEISALAQRITTPMSGESLPLALESSSEVTSSVSGAALSSIDDGSTQTVGNVPDWRHALVALWLCGVAFILLRLLTGVAGVWLLERRATMVTDGGWLHTAHDLAQRLGLARGVTLLRGDRGCVPLTWGVLQPVVWLPSGAAEWDAERRTLVLAHELAHVKRRDALTQWIANISLALHWFNPLVWVAVRRLRSERERACDDAVISLGTQPAVYAEHLLAIVRTIGNRGGPAVAIAMARRSQFEGRLLAILDGSAPRTGLGPARVLTIGSVAILLVLPLAGMTPELSSDAHRMIDLPGRYAEEGGFPAGAGVDGRESAEKPPASEAGEAGASLRGEAYPRRSVLVRPSEDSRAAVGSLLAGGARGEWLLEQAASSGDSATLLEIIAAAAEITSSAQRARVLIRIAQLDMLDPPVTAALIAATETMTSSAEKARVLGALMNRHPAAARTSGAELIGAIGSITSSSERANLLNAMLERQGLDPRVLMLALTATASVPSTMERVRLIRTTLRSQPTALGAASPTLFGLIDSIRSSVERASLLVDIVQRPDISETVLVRALESSTRIASGAERLRVLLSAASVRTLTGEARSAYIRAASTIPSGTDRAAALSAILPAGADAGSAAPPRSSREGRLGLRNVYAASDTAAGVERHVRITWHGLELRGGEIVAAGGGGTLEAEERRGPADGSAPMVKRRMIVSVSSGQPVYEYCIDDAVRTIDAEARAWFSGLLHEQALASR